MKKLVLGLFLVLSSTTYAKKQPKFSYVRISTIQGDFVVQLYSSTPKHRDNFLKLAKKGFYNGTLFHRIIPNFMIQGGDPESKNAKSNQMLGRGDLGYRVPAEFNDSLIHKRGALAAARDGNPEKASSSCQFYIVQGQRYTAEQLQIMDQRRGKKHTDAQLKIYQRVGGTPFLDGDYTVFGEVVKGLANIDNIATKPKDDADRPLEDIPMIISILDRKAALKVEFSLGIQKPNLFESIFY